MKNYKQVILARIDLQLPKGKLAAQVAHASVDAVLKSELTDVKKWCKQGMPKIVLKVKDETELIQYFQIAKDAKLITSLITDAGRTVVEPGTKTCVAIGPADEEEIDNITIHLSLM